MQTSNMFRTHDIGVTIRLYIQLRCQLLEYICYLFYISLPLRKEGKIMVTADAGNAAEQGAATKAVPDAAPETGSVSTDLEHRAAKFADNETEIDGEGKRKRDYSYTQNREVSWLRFDNRVLDEAFDPSVPLFERFKFVSIFSSNLDEWFMIRVGGLTDLSALKKQPSDNKSNMTPSEQLATLLSLLPEYLEKHDRAFEELEEALAAHGLIHVSAQDLTDADMASLHKSFETQVAPVISPLVIDPRHPFPNLRNGVLYVLTSLDGPEESGVLGMIEVPPSLDRIVMLPGDDRHVRYVLLEDLIIQELGSCFGSYVPAGAATIRVTRNADIDPDGEGVEEEEDYRLHMKKVLKKRMRLQPIRLEVEGTLPKNHEKLIRKELGLTPERVFHVRSSLDQSYIFALEDMIPKSERAQLLYSPFEPQLSPMVKKGVPMREQIEDHDVLLFYPYESMDPLLDLLREASTDDSCITIKITLYRVAKHSRLCESLIAAAENGKDVTVLMELRARFDEANNIAWAERLEDAGCTVIYGQEGYKVHSKICQITYHDGGKFTRITCLGTGNFNEKTARLYSDFMLMTAHPGIGEDGNAFFRNLSLGNLAGRYKYLRVAPIGLKPQIMGGLDREIARARAGEPAQAFLKMNSLTDRDVIDKISEACEAGVRVILIVRGICCIKANVPGKTDGLIVHQIVGRFLEHARVYAFGANIDTVYLSSADMMTRNTERRVEIAYPVKDPVCRQLVIKYMNLQLADNVKARQLTVDGTWEPIPRAESEAAINSQDELMKLAWRRSHPGLESTPVLEIPTLLEPFVSEADAKLAAAEEAREQAEAAAPAPAPASEHAAPAPAPAAAPAAASKPAPAPAAAPAPKPAPCPYQAPAPQPSRLARAGHLFGEAFRTLFGGGR